MEPGQPSGPSDVVEDMDLLRHEPTSIEGAGLLAVLHHRHYLDLVRVAVVMVDSRENAEDVVQQAFLDVLRRRPALEDAPAYLRRAVVNGARDTLRRRRVRRLWIPPHEPDAAGPEEALLLREEHRAVLQQLRRLPDRQREVLVLRHLTGLLEAETAAAGTSPSPRPKPHTTRASLPYVAASPGLKDTHEPHR